MAKLDDAVTILMLRSRLSTANQALRLAEIMLPAEARQSTLARSTPVSFAPLLKQALQKQAASADRSAQGQVAAKAPAFGDLIESAERRYNLPAGLLPNVIKAESGFNPRAVSPAGAKGLMQLMDGTARSLGVTDSFDPAQNIDGGARFLRQLLDRYGGDLRKALAGYNAGPGAVDRYGGVPPYQETQTYVSRILGYMGRA